MQLGKEGELLWQPSPERIAQSGLSAFRDWVNTRHQLNLNNYDSLWRWSVDNLEDFWEAIWLFYEVAPQAKYRSVLSSRTLPCQHNKNTPRWFEGASLNFAEYLLRQGDRGDLDRPAVIAESETLDFTADDGKAAQTISWRELRQQVVNCASYLRSRGVEPGDRVVAYMPISVEAIVAMLATVSIGGVWSSCSPDFGAKSVLERFEQIKPKVLFTISSYRYNGKSFDRADQVINIMQSLPTLKEVIYLPFLSDDSAAIHSALEKTTNCTLSQWQTCLSSHTISYADFHFEPLAFDAPIWIMFSSGTTGIPKGIVHGHGGMLLEFIKYAWLQDDVGPESVKFFFTTTGWAMFNILLGGMMAGSTIVVYDGCPTYPDASRLWKMSEAHGVTYFGVNPSYVNGLIQAAYSPKETFDVSHLKTIALTGSPSSAETFHWFYGNVHEDLHIISMSGGTDVCSAFVAGASELSVYAGEIQSACLGVDVQVFDDTGKTLPAGEDGELMIASPMPSMPISFWADPEGERYFNSYYADFDGVWRQGDLIRKTNNGGYIISGRSDSTLNRFGIRIGTAEIYRTIEALDEIKDSLIINVELAKAKFFMPLFVVLNDGYALDEALNRKIAKNLAEQCSPRHIPDAVYQIDAVPYTLTGKKLEVPIKKLLMGIAQEKALNRGAIANLASLAFFTRFAKQFLSSDK